MASMIRTFFILEIEGHVTHFVDMTFPHGDDHGDNTEENKEEED